MSRTRHSGRVVAALLLVTSSCTGIGLVTAAPASAVRHVLDGTDPQRTGCAANARTIYTVYHAADNGRVYVGGTQLRYSPTNPYAPAAQACGTAWAKMILDGEDITVPSGDWGWAQVTRMSDWRQYGCIVSGVRSCYTPQLWDGGGEQARACGQAWDPWGMNDGGIYNNRTPWKCTGAY